MGYTEKRRCERMPFRTRLTVLDAVTKRACQANSIDLSISGAQFHAGRFLVVGTHIRIRFWLGQGGQSVPVELGATVRWARVEQDGAIMGVEFDGLLSPSYCPELYEQLFARL